MQPPDPWQLGVGTPVCEASGIQQSRCQAVCYPQGGSLNWPPGEWVGATGGGQIFAERGSLEYSNAQIWFNSM